MVTVFGMLVGLIFLILSFWISWIGTVFLVGMNIFLGLILYSNRITAKNVSAPPELSYTAQVVFEKHAMLFIRPFASRDFGSLASMMMFYGVAIGLINYFMFDLSYGFLIAVANWFSMAYLSHSFNPLQMLHKQGFGSEVNSPKQKAPRGAGLRACS